MILETTFIVDLLRKKAEAIKKMEELEKDNEAHFVTAPTIHELWSGLTQISRQEEEKIKIMSILEGLPILALDTPSAEISGKIDGILVKEGRMIDPEDCMIAGIALHHKEKILSNDSHFKRIKGLNVENY